VASPKDLGVTTGIIAENDKGQALTITVMDYPIPRAHSVPR
jgi:hypothetical protein